VHLTIYGDFNCPFSALASARADVLLTLGGHEVEWRAIQHDTAIPEAGEPVDGDTAVALATELATIRELRGQDLPLVLIVPPVRSNTGLASAALAGAGGDADRLRRRLFTAVWAEGLDVGDPAVLRRLGADHEDTAAARRWQAAFDALPQPMTPTLVLSDGRIEPGLGALEWLADLATTDPQGR
jgi:2-hydroxychromene-2-carboxylate isomerase